MNKTDIEEIMSKRTMRLVLISVVVVGMIVVLVPGLIEEAEARTKAIVYNYSTFGPFFSNVKGFLDAGKWVETPNIFGPGLSWITKGSGFFGGDEKGRVLADLGPGRHVTFHWSNPSSGDNTCSVQWTGRVSASCQITQGPIAEVIYRIQAIR